MGIGSTVFNAQWNAFAEARASLRVGRKIIERCLCGSFATVRTDTDQGVYEAATASVKVRKADWPSGVVPEGCRVDFVRYGDNDWKAYRISTVSETDGILSLGMEAEFA